MKKKGGYKFRSLCLILVFFSLALIIIFGLVMVCAVSSDYSFYKHTAVSFRGGAHASKPSICLLIGTAATITMAYIAHWTGRFANGYAVLFTGLVIFSWAYYQVYKNAPVDSKAKPIVTEKKKYKMRLSFVTLSVFFSITLTLLFISITSDNITFISYSLSLYAGVIWQVITLTITGRKVLSSVDQYLDTIISFRKEKF
jgi:accessory gene regulator B